MRKTEKIFWTLITVSGIGIVAFGVAGFNNNMHVAAAALFTSGALCSIALVIKFFDWFRHRSLYGY